MARTEASAPLDSSARLVPRASATTISLVAPSMPRNGRVCLRAAVSVGQDHRPTDSSEPRLEFCARRRDYRTLAFTSPKYMRWPGVFQAREAPCCKRCRLILWCIEVLGLEKG